MFWKLAIRDATIITITGLAWRLGAHLSEGVGVVSDVTGVLLGLAIVLSAYLLHEWGHLTGALLSRSEVVAPKKLTSGYLFSFDSKANSRRQFLAMSFAGFAMTGVAIAFGYGYLPDEQLATRVARGGILLLTSLTVFIEFPLVIWSLVSQSLPPVETFSTSREESQASA